MISCYVVDDEPHAVEILVDLITQTPGLQLAGSSNSPVIALNAITGGLNPGITFVDINMPELSGMELAGLVSGHTRVIFTTAYDQYALQAFEKGAFDYLLKPVTLNRFLKCIQRFKQEQPVAADTDHFYIKGEVKGKITRINLSEVLFIEGAQNYVIIHLDDGRKISTYLTLMEMQEHLPSESFSRVHKSFLIRDDNIQTVSGNEIVLFNKKTVVIGTAYREAFLEKLNKVVLRTKRLP